MSKHLVIPDPQVRAGIPLDHLSWLGEYIVAKQPDTVICLGDWADMPSLSVYEPKGSKEFENRRYKKDVETARKAQVMLWQPLVEYNKTAKKKYRPRKVMLGGNHDEGRILRAINAAPALLDGIISLEDLGYEEFGWQYVPFLQPINIDGVMYCHYFPFGKMAKPISSARMLITKLHRSCVAGHAQGRDIAYGSRADGKTVTAIIAGSFYQHDEGYLPPLTNKHWRGFYMLHEVQDGEFDEMAVSINYLKRKYS
jgi:hypothetical protein